MFDFLKNMRDAKSVAKIEGAILALEGDHDAAVKAQARAREALEAAIDAGDARALDLAERSMDDARRQLERLTIARTSLERRLVEAREREETERLDGIVRAATARRDAVRKRLQRELAPALRTACEILQAVAAADDEVQRANDSLVTAGRPGRVDKVEDGVTPAPANQLFDLWTLRRTVSIRAIPAWGITGFNWREPGVNLNALLAAAVPPGSVGDKGAVPRPIVSNPVTTGSFVGFAD